MVAGSFREFVDEIDELARLAILDVESRFRELEVVRRRIEAEQAVMLAKLEEAKTYRADGYASMFGFLRSAPHWSERECRSRTRVGAVDRCLSGGW